MTFRINAKNFFLTYPHCNLDLERFIHSADKYIIAREQHADGTDHIHCFLHYDVKKNIRSQNHFDVEAYHCNIQSCRSISGVLSYVTKGCNYITNMSEDEIKQGSVLSKRQILAQTILEEGLTHKLIKFNPEVIFLNFENTHKWLELYSRFRATAPPERPLDKRRHLWIYGPSNTGKTLSLDRFKRGKRCFEIPGNNDWRGAETAEILWSDEYKGHLTVQQLNRLCDGNASLNTKGGSTHIYYPTILIVSNYSIRDCYSKLEDSILLTLYNRFTEYESPLRYLL